MVVNERVEDLYEFNIKGNFEEKLRTLTTSVDAAQKKWKELKSQFFGGAEFKRPKEEIEALSGAARKSAEAANKLRSAEEKLAKNSEILARAQNTLVKESNKLQVSRKVELTALEQYNRQANPRIINARAEAEAISRLSGELQRIAADRKFAQLAAEAGLKVSADSKRIFNAEAEAARRATKAQQELAVARLLSARGLKSDGTPETDLQGPPLPDNIRRAQEAEKKFRQDLERADIKKRTDELKKNSDEWRRLAQNTERTVVPLRQVEKEGKKVESTYNRVAFTFRRLIGIFAAFTVVRVVTREFGRLIATAIRFNAEIERNRVGLSGLIAAAGDIRGPQGELIGIQQQLNIAQNVSIEQMNELRRAAINTTASYEDLANAFSSAIAPGLQSGLNVDQIREITVQISQAATGLGLAQNQLAEEVRSLFQGTITPRNTRIATALGISNEDVRRARELGTLYEFLSNRFEAIAATGKRLADTFSGSLNRAVDAFKQLLAEASKPLFEQLKGAIDEIRNGIFPEGGQGTDLFNKESLGAFRALFEGLASGVDGIRRAFRSIDADGLRDTFSAIGQTIGLLATSLASVLATAFNISTPLIAIFSTIVSVINSVVKAVTEINAQFGGWLTTIARIYVTQKVLNALWLRARGIWKSIFVITAATKALQVDAFTGTTLVAKTTENTVRQAGRLSRAFSGLRAVINRSMLGPLLIVGSVLFIIETVLETLKIKFSVFDALGEVFSKIGDVIDKALGAGEGLSEAANKKTEKDVGLIANSFNDVKAQIEDLVRTLDIEFSLAVKDLSLLERTLGLDSDFARQVEQQANGLREFDAQVINSVATLESLKKQLQLAKEEAKEPFGPFDIDFESQNQRLQQEIAVGNELRDRLEKIKANNTRFGRLSDLSPGRQETEKKILDLTLQIEESDRKKNFLVKQIKDANEFVTANKKEQIRLDTEIETLTGLINQGKIAAIRNNQKEIEQLSEIAQFNLNQKALNFESDFQAASAAVLAAQQTSQLQAEFLRAESRVIEAQAQRLQARFRAEKALVEIGQTRLRAQEEAEQNGLKVNKDLEDSLKQQEALILRNLRGEDIILKTKEQQALVERELARLRKEGSINQGLGFGLQRFADENSSEFNVGERFGQDLANSISSFGATALSEAVASAFDPERNFDLKEAASTLLFSLGTGLLEDLIKNTLSDAIKSFSEQLPKTSQALLDQQAISEIQKQAAAAAGKTLITDAATAGSSLSAGGLAAGQALVSSALLAKTILSSNFGSGGAGAGVVTGALAGLGGGATGGRARDIAGFALGGRPSHIDKRDTIPAYLRPGEWVIRPEAVRKYGDGLFSALNGMKLSPSALKGLAFGQPRVADPKPKRSFATGGSVSASSSRGRQSPINIQFFDEQVMDRAFAAGPNASLRFARRRRSDYRAALGLEPGT